jgi:hypothetical protein
MSFLGNSELAVSQSVPQLNCPVARSRNNLPVVGGEGNGKDVVVVSNKSASCGTGGELPETEGLVPRGGEGICTVR